MYEVASTHQLEINVWGFVLVQYTRRSIERMTDGVDKFLSEDRQEYVLRAAEISCIVLIFFNCPT